MSYRRVCAGLLAVACAVAAGCGSSSDDGASTSDGAAGGDAKHYEVGIVGFATADPTTQLAVKAYQSVAKRRGWDVTVIDAQGAPDKAVAAMQNLAQKRVDLIVTFVFPAQALAGGAAAARAAGIPVVSLGGSTGPGVQYAYNGGVTQGRAIAGQLVSDMGGRGDLLLFGYKPGLPCVEREQQVQDAIADTGIATQREEVPVPGQVEAGVKLTQAWLAKHPSGGDGLAVFGCFEDPALGALAALKQSGRDDVHVYGVNGSPPAIKAIRDGEMDATVYLDAFRAGQQAAERTPQYVEGGVDAPAKTVPLPSELVTQANVKQFLAEHPEAMAGDGSSS
jgi:ribose transport system substrate-binding protein